MEHGCNDTDMGKLKYLAKTLLVMAFFTSDCTWNGLGLNSCFYSERLHAGV
jgi:hypothetical protein